jgi:hypothetical protein
MLSNYLQSPATVLEKLSNHIAAKSVETRVKKIEQMLQDLSIALKIPGDDRNVRNGSAG